MKKVLFFLTLFLLSAGMSWAQNVAKNATKGVEYGTLQAAIDAADPGDSIVVLTDHDVDAVISVAKNLIINGGNHTINTTAARGLWTDATGVNLTLRNFNLNGGASTERGVQVNDPSVTIVMDHCRIIMQKKPNYAILTLEYQDPSTKTIPNENLNMTVTNCYIQGLEVLRSMAPGAHFIFENDTLHGINPYNNCPNSGNNFAVIRLDGDATHGDGKGSKNSTISIKDCRIIAEEKGNCSEEWFAFGDGASLVSATVDANTVILDGNEKDITDEVNNDGEGNTITMPLTNAQKEKFLNDPYTTLVDNGDGTYTVSANVYYSWITNGVYCDFHGPFKEGWLADEETIDLLENVTMTDTVSPGGVKFYLNSNGKTITKGEYCVKLVEGDVVITDGTMDIFCSEDGNVVELDNGNGTYTYTIGVAKIGDEIFPTLQEAVDYANGYLTGDVTIELIQNTTEYVEVLQKNTNNLTIDGKGNTLTGQMYISAKCENWDGSDWITVTNMNFKYDANYFDGNASDPANEKGLLTFCKNCGSDRIKCDKNYAHNVTISNCNFDADGSNQGAYAIASIAGSVNHLVIENCTAKNAKALATLQSDPQFVLTGCSTEDVTYGVRIVNNDGPMTVSHNNFKADEAGIYVCYMTSGATINFSEDTVNAPKAFLLDTTSTNGTLDITSGKYIGTIDDNATSDFFNISGGTYSEDVTGEPCAPGYAAFDNGDGTWTVTKAWFLRYNANGGTGTMDSAFVKQSDDAAGRTVTVADCNYTYDSYAFAEWNTKADGTGNRVAPGAQLTLTQDTVLYAQWARVKNVTKDILYDNLQTAINAATANDSLVILTDMTIGAITGKSTSIEIVKSLTINGLKHTITSTASRGLWVNASNVNLTLRNFYLDCTNTSEEGVRGVQLNGMDASVFSNNTLLMDSCRVTTAGKFGKSYAMNLTCYGHDFTVTVKNSYIKGWAALNSYAKDIHFVFENDTLHGVNQLSTSSWDNFATINLDGGSTACTGYGTENCVVDLVNTVVIAEEQGTCKQDWGDIKYGTSYAHINADCQSKMIDATGQDVKTKVLFSNVGPGNTITIPSLSDDQKTILANDFVLTDNAGGECVTTTLSYNVYYYWESGSGFEGTYTSFNSPFTKHWLAAGEYIDLLDDVNMTQDVYSPFTGNFTIHFKEGSETHTINQGGYTVVLDDDQTCTTDNQALALFSSINGSSITETDNGNGTWTYSVTPYYFITYDANDGTGIFDAQTKPQDSTITLLDGTALSKTDSTLYWWNTAADESGTGYALGAKYSDNADLDLFAAWRLNLDMKMDSTDVVCYGENNGTDTVKIIGGEAPFQLVLSGTALSENDTVKSLMDRTYIYKNLKPGSYTVTLTDTLKKDIITGTFTIAQPDTLEITSLTVPEKPCPLMGTGVYNVSVAAQGGNTGNYTYTWGEAAVNIDADATTVVSGADDRDSTYTVSVTVIDSKGCTATATTTFSVSPVIADDGTVHSNTKLEVTPDTIKFGIYQGCDTVIKDYGTPTFTFTNPAITEDILDTIYNDVAANFPDSIFPVGTSIITWTAVDTCGHSVTYEQPVIIFQYPCPNAVDKENNSYPAVRIGCTCWMAENLKSTKYSDGRDIENVMTYVNSDYPNEVENASIYGHLYDWYAAVDTAINSIASVAHKDSLGKRVQGVCPAGWYLPNEKDLADLYSYDTKDLRSTDLWIEGGGTNATGFHAVPSGFFNCSTGRYEELKGECIYWSCHPVYDKVTGAIISYVCDRLMSNSMEMCNGLSVRCLLITEPQD